MDQQTQEVNIEKVLKAKNPAAAKLIPGFAINYLKKIAHQNEINEFIRDHNHLGGIAYADAIVDYYLSKLTIKGEENIPKEGRFVFAANHPLGGLDGMAFTSAVGKHFKELKFPVNDILMNIKNLNSIFLPVNKHGGHSREAVRLIDEAYASDAQILMFPAGLVSRKTPQGIIDPPWQKSFVKKAIAHQRSIIPVHISGRNSNFFYNLANFRKRIGLKINLEMLYLVDEVYKFKGNPIEVKFGKPIHYEDLKKDFSIDEWSQKIKEQAYALSK